MKRHPLHILGAIAAITLAATTGCGPSASRFEGSWVKSDSIGNVGIHERLNLLPGGEFTQDYTVNNAGKNAGSLSVGGKWKMERHGIVLEYDTLATHWRGDSLMGAAFTEEFARGLSRIAADTQFGLSDVELRGTDTLCASQSGVKIRYTREKNGATPK